MTAEVGHFALVLALAVSLVQALSGLGRGSSRRVVLAPSAARVQFLLMAIAFVALSGVFARADFSVRIVFEHTHSAQPLFYRIAGSWGNHEGSMLLWALMLALFGALLSFSPRIDPGLRDRALGFFGVVGFVFLAFIEFTSNPFDRLNPAPLEGLDLNPVLQDPALALHPPVLYFGYVGFAAAFALAMAGLVNNRIDQEWARAVRPFVMLAWLALTLGIAFGSYWAYYELGWGGYWFWDPVENASLLPWLAGTALLHSVRVVERRGALKAWTVLLAILAFAMSLLGTFLVRSGVLISVHAFASNPDRGLFILGIVVGLIGGAFVLFAWRARSLSNGPAFQPLSREGLIVFNNLMLSTIASAILLGTLYPVIVSALSGDLISVGPPYFNLVCGMLAIPLFAAFPLGPIAAWKQASWAALISRLWIAAGAFLIVLIALFAVLGGLSTLAATAGIAASAWLILGSFVDLANRTGTGSLLDRLTTLRRLPMRAYGAALAHAGVGMVLLGISASGAFKSSMTEAMKVGDSFKLAGETVVLASIADRAAPAYEATAAEFRIERGHERTVRSEHRHYPSRDITTTEVGLLREGLSMTYIVLGDVRGDDGNRVWIVRAYHQPLILLIWLGAGIIALGGAVTLPKRVRLSFAPRQKSVVAAARTVQAE